ncbi:MAG: flagellar biosynthesis protein [Armatimonadetes bacterium]|nr:flagellar biosynthesis protein [Armatimonadota bacterium]
MSTPIQNSKIGEILANRAVVQPRPTPGTQESKEGFQALLSDRLKVSGHAQTRLASRNIELGKAEWDRVMGGVDKAAAKGAKESLVMLDDIALVVSVKNRTVITAVDKTQLKDNVFTNIDSAIIV